MYHNSGRLGSPVFQLPHKNSTAASRSAGSDWYDNYKISQKNCQQGCNSPLQRAIHPAEGDPIKIPLAPAPQIHYNRVQRSVQPPFARKMERP